MCTLNYWAASTRRQCALHPIRAYRQRQGELQARGAAWASRVTRSAAATATAKASSAQQKAIKKPEQPQQKRAKAGKGPQQQQPRQCRAPQQQLQQPAARSRKRNSEPSVQQSPQQLSKADVNSCSRACWKLNNNYALADASSKWPGVPVGGMHHLRMPRRSCHWLLCTTVAFLNFLQASLRYLIVLWHSKIPFVHGHLSIPTCITTICGHM